MPTDYYDDGPAPDQTEARSSAKMDRKDPDDSGKTALIPSSLCPGMDVGDSVTLEIVAVREDEYEVRYRKGESESEDEPSMERASEATESPEDMGSYME